jgi:DNA replication protein DnaC
MNVQCQQAKEIKYKHVSHNFDIQISEMTLTQEQEGVLDSIMANPEGLHVLTGTPGSGKSFFIKYITQYLQLKGKTILLSGTTGATARRLSKTANTVHTTFRIPTRGYLSCLPKSNKILDKIKTSDVIIIDEMSMLTSYVLCVIEQRLK